MNFIKRFAILFAIFTFTSCSIQNPDSSNSNIYLITVGNDYYRLPTSTLPDCINDNYGIISQFKELSGGKNFESLSFLTQFGNGYIIDGFDKNDFVKCGMKISSYESNPLLNSIKKGEWKASVQNSPSNETIIFRIGKAVEGKAASDGYSVSKSDDDYDWGAELVMFNSVIGEPGSGPYLKYSEDYVVYYYSDDKDKGERYISITNIPKGSIFPFEFDYQGDRYIDKSAYNTSKNFYANSGSLSTLFNSYEPGYIYELSDDDLSSDDGYTKFTAWKIKGPNPQKWTWKKDGSSPESSGDCVYAYDFIRNWLRSKTIKADDVIIFYNSGHGENGIVRNEHTGDKDKATASTGALIMPSEQDGKTVSVKPVEILDLFNSYDCHKVYIIDSCHSGNFLNYTTDDLQDCDEYEVAYTSGLGGSGRSVYDYYLGKSNVFKCIFSGISDTSEDRYKNSWIITGSTFRNPSLSGVDIYYGTSVRYGAMTSCILNYLGYDIRKSKPAADPYDRKTVHSIMKSVLNDFPKYYRAYNDGSESGAELTLSNSQNPQMKHSFVDLVLF